MFNCRVDYKGENFARFSGDTQQHANAQLFAWEAHERGVDVHLLAEPTKLELLKQEYDKKRDELKDKARDSIINRYGGEEHLDAPPPSLLLAQTEQYVEYSRYGKVSKRPDFYDINVCENLITFVMYIYRSSRDKTDK